MNGPPFRTWAEVSLRRLRLNFGAIANALKPGVAIAPVVKADAYGHGAIRVSQALEKAGANWLAVSCVSEGVALRKAGIGARVLVMGGLLPFERQAAVRYLLTPVVHSLEELAAWDHASESIAVHLKIDTGMSRLGSAAAPADVVAAVRALQHIRVEGLMSHFASAEDFTSSQTGDQIARFEALRTAVREAGIRMDVEHFSSTNALAYSRQGAMLSLVRPGLATYGYVSPGEGSPPLSFEVSPVLTWYARLLNVHQIAAGTPVGYRARFTAPHAMRIGTVAVGYADGIPHRLSTRGSLISEGRLLPILGAVSMDLTTVDLTSAPELQPGNPVTVLGPGMNAQQIANIAGEIPYSVLCGIGKRVSRIYSDS